MVGKKKVFIMIIIFITFNIGPDANSVRRKAQDKCLFL